MIMRIIPACSLGLLAALSIPLTAPAWAQSAEPEDHSGHSHSEDHEDHDIEEIIVRATPLNRDLVEISQSATVLRGEALNRLGRSDEALDVLLRAVELDPDNARAYQVMGMIYDRKRMPELATAIAAVRIGAFDLAVGSLLGSNAFNMAIIFIVDISNSVRFVL